MHSKQSKPPTITHIQRSKEPAFATLSNHPSPVFLRAPRGVRHPQTRAWLQLMGSSIRCGSAPPKATSLGSRSSLSVKKTPKWGRLARPFRTSLGGCRLGSSAAGEWVELVAKE